MFRSKETSKLLTWHGRKREVNDLLQQPKDALSWKKIDNLWPEFGSEPRNLRLALSTDGVNPHGDLSSRYSCWPVMLVTYNLPPLDQAHLYVIQNVNDVLPYVEYVLNPIYSHST